MNFLDRYMQGDFDKTGREDKEVVMNKTISSSSDPSVDTIKIDHLDKDNTLEKDIFKQRKAERDVTGTVALPLFRFEEKQKEEIINVLKQIVEIGREEVKNNIGGPYTPLFGYIDIVKSSDVKFLVDLVVTRNKELFNTSSKEFEIEIITCYIDKKLRVKLHLEEDKILDEKIDGEYFVAKKAIHNAFTKLYQEILNRLKLKSTGTEKDIEITLKESAGDENYGTGYSIFLKYKKLIDYTNQRRGKESYNMLESVLDEDFSKALENEENAHLIEEQISINDFSRSSEAIADGMSENSEDSSQDETSENQENSDDAIESEETNDDLGDDMNEDGGEGDDMMDGDEGDDSSDGSSDTSSTSSDSGSSKEPKVSGRNPFTDLNSKNKISVELNELKDQIDKVLIKLGQFKSNVVVKKLVELRSFVEDALKNSYIVPLQDSLMRYSLYATQFEDLISELTKYFESSKKIQES